ncbi:MAG TPA: glycosyltransferase family 2 protein [Solirubrobacteraceae bacterium]|nr:glycosyltransferase family 2 protein [Solirubrobacteraceae bacterium]
MARLTTAMWASLGLIAWTHAGYPLAAAAAAARRRYEPRRDPAHLPSVALIIAAHDEERVIAARLENALALDYPGLEIIVSLDGSTDGTRAIVERFPGVRLLVNERGGKVAAQNAAARATDADVLAFSDANSMWEPDALRRLVAVLADPEVGYVCGRLRLVGTSGENLEGQYWRYELWLREQESRLGSITAGNGAIYAVRRSAYVELPSTSSHDIGLPFRLRRAGLRAVYEPSAVAVEPAAATTSDEWSRKVRMLSRSWGDLLLGGMLDPRRQPPGYFAELLSHRLLRYSSGLLHVFLLASCVALAPVSRSARALLAAHAAGAALAVAGRRGVPLAAFAWYYVVVTAASVAGLARMLRDGPQATWTPVEGTR